MKRVLCLILFFCLMLSGCSITGDRIKEPVIFYYVDKNYQKEMDQVIVSEVREASGHREDLSYLLALYSIGPSNEDLMSLLPRNTHITVAEHASDSIQLELSEIAQTMTDSDFTLACACIALTCMELTEVPQITVACGERNITIREDNLLLHSSAQKPQEDVN